MNKKLIAVTLLLVMLAGVFLTGCSTTEIQYYELLKKVSQLDVFEDNGELTLDLNNLPADLTNEKEAKVILDALKDYKLTYSGKTDYKNEALEYNFYFQDKATGSKTEAFALIAKGDTIYYDLQGLLTFVKSIAPAEEYAQFEALIGETRYISINSKEMGDTFNDLYGMPLFGADDFNIFKNAKDQQNLGFRIFEGLIKEVFDKYETKNLVQKNNNKYTLSLTAKNVTDNIKPLADYSIDNIDKFGTFATKFVNSLTPAEFKLLQLNAEDKDTYLAQIEEAVSAAKLSSKEAKEEIAKLDLNKIDDPELKAILDNLKLIISVEAKANNTYTTEFELNFKAGSKADDFTFKMAAKSDITPINSFDVKAPTENVMSYTELKSKMTSTLKIDLNNGTYDLTGLGEAENGKIELKSIKGSTYLPLKAVGNILGEEVNWDSKANKAFVRDIFDEKIYLEGQVTNGKSYVKLREFEKLDYKVNWDSQTNTVTITK